MKQATLIYNPVAGRNPTRRGRQIERARAALGDAGFAVTPARTTGPGAATELARAAAAAGSDLVIACGGDGTIYEVVNGLAPSNIPLGILPGGTANIIANELRLPHDPVKAARALPSWQPRRIALGRVTGRAIPPSDGAVERYFLSVAGVGYDAYVIYHLGWKFKTALGAAAYVLEGMRQVLRYPFHPIACRMDGEEHAATFAVIQRTSLYAGWFRTAPGQSIGNRRFGISLFKSRNRFRYFLYGGAILVGQRMNDMPLTAASEASFNPVEPAARVFFELDGELAGILPAKFDVAPDALTLLLPPERARSFEPA